MPFWVPIQKESGTSPLSHTFEKVVRLGWTRQQRQMFYITAFTATQEQAKPELKNEKSDTIAQGRQAKRATPQRRLRCETRTLLPFPSSQRIAGKRMARRAWPASAWSTSINREKILGSEGKAWSKWKDWENGHDDIEKKDAFNELMTWGFANGVFNAFARYSRPCSSLTANGTFQATNGVRNSPHQVFLTMKPHNRSPSSPRRFFRPRFSAPFLIVLLATNVERANNVANSLASWLYRTRLHSARPPLAHLPAGLGEKRAHGFE